MLLSIIVPVYKEEKNVPEFLRRMREVLAGVTEDYEIIFSLDPSPDRTEEAILEAREQDGRVNSVSADWLQGDLGGQIGRQAGLEHAGSGPHLQILR